MSAGSDPDELLTGLDDEQRAVATALTGPVVVIAGAGTGKTRAITHRIAYGVAVGAYAPTGVLALTFTTRAAGELRGRLQRLGARGVQARTFHSAALRQAQYFWPRAYGSEFPPLLEHRMSLVAEAAGRLRLHVDTARLRDLLGEISWAKVSNTTPTDYAQVAPPLGRSVAGVTPELMGRVFSAYEELKRQRGRVDFEDILLCTAALLAEHDQVRIQVQRTYPQLVVDEFQDVSPLQHRLLDLWRERDELCVVGDPAQTIHSFAGARADFLTGFAERHPGATVIRLVRDYRSTPQVVAAANTVMQAAATDTAGGGSSGLAAVTLVAQRPPGPAPVLREAPDESSEAAGIADWLSGLASAGTDYREMAVLFRINAQSPAIEQALADRSIPYLVRGGERFYERAEVRQALHAIRTQARAVTELDPDRPGAAVDQVRAIFGALGWTPEPPSGAGAVRERWESLAALLSVAEDLSRAVPTIDLPAIVAELDRRAEAQQVPAAQGVTVSTLHSAKGLEWDAVALFGAQEGSLPFVLATRPDEIAEERRLLYVGLTRAREHLHVSWARSRNGGQGNRKPSRFLAPLLGPGYGSAGPSGPTRRRRTNTVMTARCRSCGRSLAEPAERKLGRHTGCPSTYDENTLTLLKEWRRQQAAADKLPAFCVFTDATLVAIAETNPADSRGLLRISGVGPSKLEKYGEQVLAILAS